MTGGGRSARLEVKAIDLPPSAFLLAAMSRTALSEWSSPRLINLAAGPP